MKILEQIKENIKRELGLLLATYIPALLVIMADVSSKDISLSYSAELIFVLALGFFVACILSLKKRVLIIIGPFISIALTSLIHNDWGFLIYFIVISLVIFVGVKRESRKNIQTSQVKN